MECPVCGERLRPTEKCGVEVDICPACKGLWLERGKLETILSRATALPSEQAPAPVAAGAPQMSATSYTTHPPQRTEYGDHDEHPGHHDGDHQHSRQRRRGSWIGDLLGGLGGED